MVSDSSDGKKRKRDFQNDVLWADVFGFSEWQEFKGGVCRILWLQVSLYLIRLEMFSERAGWKYTWGLRASPRSHPAKWEGAQPWVGPRSGKRSYLDKAGPPTPAPLPSVDLCWHLWSVHDATDHTSTRLWQSPFLWPVTWFVRNLSNWGKWVPLPVQSLSSPVYSSLFTRTYFPECCVKNVYNLGNTKFSTMHFPWFLCQHQGQATWPILLSPSW